MLLTFSQVAQGAIGYSTLLSPLCAVGADLKDSHRSLLSIPYTAAALSLLAASRTVWTLQLSTSRYAGYDAESCELGQLQLIL